MNEPTVSAIVPTYNEAGTILDHLRYHTRRFDFQSITVVDGGSSDGTLDRIRTVERPVRCIQVTPGNRSRQLAEGVRTTSSDYLLFLHADSYLPASFSVERIPRSDARWGWFDVRLDDNGVLFETIGSMISLRSALFSSPTGDQAIWVKRTLLEKIGGIPELPLMEDLELSNRLSGLEAGHRFTDPVETSARRWRKNGPIRTILTMWGLKVGYYLGVPSDTLAEYYYGRTKTSGG